MCIVYISMFMFSLDINAEEPWYLIISSNLEQLLRVTETYKASLQTLSVSSLISTPPTTQTQTNLQVRLDSIQVINVLQCHICRVRLGQVRLGQVRLGQVRLGQVRIGQVRLVQLGQDRLGQVRSVRFGWLGWVSQDRSVMLGQVDQVSQVRSVSNVRLGFFTVSDIKVEKNPSFFQSIFRRPSFVN